MYHGEKVAFGTITQLVLENIPADELEDIINWCIGAGPACDPEGAWN